MLKQKKDKLDKKPSGRSGDLMKYSGMAFQMGIIIWIGTFFGQKVDAHFQTESPYFTALGAFLGLAAALYTTFKDLFFGK